MLQRISRRLTLIVFLLALVVPVVHAQTGTDPEPTSPGGTTAGTLILTVLSILPIG